MPLPESPSFNQAVAKEKRKLDADKVLNKFEGRRIPIIVERAQSAAEALPLLDKKKYLVPDHFTYAQFVAVIRKRIKLTPEEAIFLFINNVVPPSTMTMGQLYNEHKDDDNFLKAVYSNENAFGL